MYDAGNAEESVLLRVSDWCWAPRSGDIVRGESNRERVDCGRAVPCIFLVGTVGK